MPSIKQHKSIFLLALLLLGYLVFVLVTHLYIPCPFRLVTGYKCPGCGVSHMCVACVQLRFQDAFQANPFLFVTGPFLLIEMVYLYHKPKLTSLHQVLLWLYVIALIVFGIVRNL